MLTTEQITAMQVTLEHLERELLQYSAAVATSIDVSGGSSRSGATTLIKEMRESIAWLEQRRQYVMNGTWTFQKWSDLAVSFHQVMQSSIKDVSAWNLSGYLSNVASSTARDTAAAAKTATAIGVPVALLALGALVFLKAGG